MTVLAPVIKFRWFDGDGEPLAGGKVYTYIAGTTTPLATYTDYTGLVPNTNPVILDSDGYADIWLGAAFYKFVIADENDVVLITTDNVAGDITSGGGSEADGGFGAAQDVASASIIDLGAVESHFANITGTTTINGLGANALTDAPIYLLKFQSALTLNNSANLILPSARDITTEPNDRALVEYLGSGIWRVWGYMRASGNPLWLDNIVVTGTITGDGSLTLNGTAAAGASIYMGEDTDNGTNKVQLKAPDLLASDILVNLPSEAGTVQLWTKQAILTYEVAAGADGGAATADTWTTRPINTESDPDNIVTLASNQFQVATTGIYRVSAMMQVFGESSQVSLAKCRLYNVTDATLVAPGLTGGVIFPSGTSGNIPLSVPERVVTLTAGKNYALQYYIDIVGGAGRNLGYAYANAASGSSEVYAQINVTYLHA